MCQKKVITKTSIKRTSFAINFDKVSRRQLLLPISENKGRAGVLIDDNNSHLKTRFLLRISAREKAFYRTNAYHHL